MNSSISNSNDQGDVELLFEWSCRKLFSTLESSFDQTLGKVSGDLQRFSDGATLSHQARNGVTGAKEAPFRESLDMHLDQLLVHGLICDLTTLGSSALVAAP